MSNLLRCFGSTENRLYLGQKQCKSKAETRLVLAMLRRSLRSLESKLNPIGLVRLSVCTVFRVSNSAPCILLTLTHRLRVISNAYFDTPSLGNPNYFWVPTR